MYRVTICYGMFVGRVVLTTALVATLAAGCVASDTTDAEGTISQAATVTGWDSCSGVGCTPGTSLSPAPQVIANGANPPLISSASTWKNTNGSSETRGAGAALLQVDLLSYNQCQWDRDCPQPAGNYGYCVKYPAIGASYCAVRVPDTCYDGPCGQPGATPAGAGVLTIAAGGTVTRSYAAIPNITPSSTSSPVFAAITMTNATSPAPCANTNLLDPSSGSLQQVNEDPTQCARDVSETFVLDQGQWACDRWPGGYWDPWLHICWTPA
jgi:hypothetical protein